MEDVACIAVQLQSCIRRSIIGVAHFCIIPEVNGFKESIYRCNKLVNYLTRRKTFTHEKRDQVGMDLVRSTEANWNHICKHACNTHPCNSLYIYI